MHLLTLGSAPYRVLDFLNTSGADCATEITAYLGISERTVRNACRMLCQEGRMISRAEERTIRRAGHFVQQAVLVYSITRKGRSALKAAA